MNRKRTLALFIMITIVLGTVGQAVGQEAGPQRPQGTVDTGASTPLGTAFTYQGQLILDGAPVNDECDFQFGLWDAASMGIPIGPTQSKTDVDVSGGLFTVQLDFGAGALGGDARWLEAAVRCPAGSGDYATLEPRQELTAAPAALALVLPYTAQVNISVPAVTFRNYGEGEAALLRSEQGNALWVESAGQDGVHVDSAASAGLAVDEAGTDGVYVGRAGNPSAAYPVPASNGFEVAGAQYYGLWVGQADVGGVRVMSAGIGFEIDEAQSYGVDVGLAHGDGVYVASAGDNGFEVGFAGSPSSGGPSDVYNGFAVGGAQRNGLYVARADQNGVRVLSAGAQGVQVDAAEGTGVYVGAAGSASTTYPSGTHNGFEVAGAQNFGLYVGRADDIGVEVLSAGYGLDVHAADHDGVNVYSAGADGVHVELAGGDGVQVWSADAKGFRVENAGYDGFYVWRAGAPSQARESDSRNGFEVGGAQGHGLYVGRADESGVYVVSAGWNGIVVDAAGGDGVRATNTTYNALYGDTANAQGEWGLYTPDKIHAQNVTLQTLTLIAQVSGSDALAPGDVVAAAGVGAPLQGSATPLPLVRLAGSGARGVIGVVEGRLALTPLPQPEGAEAEERLELRSAEGPARAGDFVALTVLGLARVKVDTDQGGIQPGARLTGAAGGRARPLKTVVVEGVTLAESAPALGIALAAPDGDGLAWVLVNPQ